MTNPKAEAARIHTEGTESNCVVAFVPLVGGWVRKPH